MSKIKQFGKYTFSFFIISMFPIFFHVLLVVSPFIFGSSPPPFLVNMVLIVFWPIVSCSYSFCHTLLLCRKEIRSVQKELEALSVQHTQKCLENSRLSQKLHAERQSVVQYQRGNQEHTNKQVHTCCFHKVSSVFSFNWHTYMHVCLYKTV